MKCTNSSHLACYYSICLSKLKFVPFFSLRVASHSKLVKGQHYFGMAKAFQKCTFNFSKAAGHWFICSCTNSYIILFKIKYVFRAFIAWWKPRRTLGRIREEISENLRCSRGFSPAREFSQTLPRFSTGYGGRDNMFYLFYMIIIFSLSKEKDDIRSAYCKFLQLGDNQTTLLTSFSYFIAL